MASPGRTPKRRWQGIQRFAGNLVALTASEAPRLIRQLQQIPAVQRGIQRGIEQGVRIGIDVLTSGALRPATAVPAGRPVTSISTPTAHRARKLVYAPDLTGRADPGEIVWAWVAYADDPGRGADRPVLVVGRDRGTLLALMLSSRPPENEPGWLGIGPGGWEDTDRPSWVRLDRVLDVPEEGIRREGTILQRATFEIVAARLRADYAWS